jgi:hypothetical protein
MMLALEVLSNNDWTVDDPDAYALALDVQYKIAPLTILAGVNYGFAPFATTSVGSTAGQVAVIGFGLKVSADTDMVDGWVGFDGGFGTDFEYEFGAGATATLFEVTTAEVAVTYNTGLTVLGDSDLDLKVIFTEPAAKGLVDNLDVKVQVYLLDLLTTVSEYEVLVDAGYLMGKIYPHVSVDFGNDVNTGSTVVALNGEFFYLTVGVDWTAIPLTTLSVHYTSGDLWETNALMGVIDFSAKVAY